MRKSLTGLVMVGLALSLAACGSNDTSTTGVNANMGATIGIAMPTKVSERWIADGKNMVQQFTDMGYKVNLQYADNDVKNQVAQVQSMVDQGDKLLVIAAIDGSSMDAVLAKAASKNIPVIAYDRLLTGTPNVTYQATFDNLRVGTMQAQLLVDRLGLTKEARGPFNVELFAGSPTDANAKSFYNGAMPVLEPYISAGQIVIRSGQTTFDSVSTVNYDAKIAGTRMKKILAANYAGAKLDAVLSPYDGMSIGILNVLKAAGYGTAGKPIPIVSGQDAELASVKSIIADQQTGTIYKDTRELAKVAVQMGNSLLTGEKPIVNDTETYDNGVKVVPTYLLQPVAVDKANYKALLVDGGYYTEADLNS